MQRKPPCAPLSILESRILEAEAAVDAAFERVAAADARLAALVELLEDQGDHEPEIREAGEGGWNEVHEDARLIAVRPGLLEWRGCPAPEILADHAGIPVEWLTGRN